MTEATEDEKATRVGTLHEAHAEFIKRELGIDVTPEQIFAVYSTRVRFRKSDDYQTKVREGKASAAEAKEAAKAEAKAAREAERAKKAEEKAAEKVKREQERAEAKAKKEKEAADKAAAKAKADAAKPAATSQEELAKTTPAKTAPKSTDKEKAKTAPF